MPVGAYNCRRLFKVCVGVCVRGVGAGTGAACRTVGRLIPMAAGTYANYQITDHGVHSTQRGVLRAMGGVSLLVHR